MRKVDAGAVGIAGWAGECPDGYLDLVRQDIPDKAKKLVRDINAKRRAKYQKTAKRTGATLKSVEVTSGAKLIERALPGELIKTPAGEWVKK